MYCIEELGLYLCFLKTYILLKNEDCSSGHGGDNWSFSALNLGEKKNKIMTMLFETIYIYSDVENDEDNVNDYDDGDDDHGQNHDHNGDDM